MGLDSKKRKRNVIFFMVVRLTLNMKEKYYNDYNYDYDYDYDYKTYKKRAAMENKMLAKGDPVMKKTSVSDAIFQNFENRFNKVGYVMDVINDKDVVKRV